MYCDTTVTWAENRVKISGLVTQDCKILGKYGSNDGLRAKLLMYFWQERSGGGRSASSQISLLLVCCRTGLNLATGLTQQET